MHCFNRSRDLNKISRFILDWKGPFSWQKFEGVNGCTPLIDIEGIYLFTFKYKNGFILNAAGVTVSTKKRFSEHNRSYLNGNYTVLDVRSAQKVFVKKSGMAGHMLKTTVTSLI
jgi:hypothetical protein